MSTPQCKGLLETLGRATGNFNANIFRGVQGPQLALVGGNYHPGLMGMIPSLVTTSKFAGSAEWGAYRARKMTKGSDNQCLDKHIIPASAAAYWPDQEPHAIYAEQSEKIVPWQRLWQPWVQLHKAIWTSPLRFGVPFFTLQSHKITKPCHVAIPISSLMPHQQHKDHTAI